MVRRLSSQQAGAVAAVTSTKDARVASQSRAIDNTELDNGKENSPPGDATITLVIDRLDAVKDRNDREARVQMLVLYRN